MKKTVLVVPVASVALFLGGCPSSPPSTEQAAQPSPSPTVQASPSSPPPAFNTALQPGKVSTTTPKVPGLIPATNPNQQRQTVKQGRTDPFALLPVEPIVKYPIPQPAKTTKPGSVPTLSSTGQKPSRPYRANVRTTPPTPPKPQPNEALGVVVSGVLDLPTSPVAIVKAPGESVVRRVTPGSTLSNGQVLVKAIYAGSSNPVVVLEQNGVQITRRVGEGAEDVSTPKAI